MQDKQIPIVVAKELYKRVSEDGWRREIGRRKGEVTRLAKVIEAQAVTCEETVKSLTGKISQRRREEEDLTKSKSKLNMNAPGIKNPAWNKQFSSLASNEADGASFLNVLAHKVTTYKLLVRAYNECLF